MSMSVNHFSKQIQYVLSKENRINFLLKESWTPTIFNLYFSWFIALDHVFETNIIVYCQQNRYARLAIYKDLFTLITNW